MKKRRELDALVGNGKLRRKCRGGSSGQELLRGATSGGEDDTDSSETEFTVPAQKAIIRKRSRSSVCTTCLTVSGFLVLVACLVACGTLLWMHFALRKNLDYFQKKLETVENRNQFTPEEFQRLHTHIQELNKTINSLKSGKNGLQAIMTNVTLLTKEVTELKVKALSLETRLADTPLLHTLPKKVKTMSNSLSSQGSDLGVLHSTVDTYFKKNTENLNNITTNIKDLRAQFKEFQLESRHADNFTFDTTKITTQFLDELNSTESKLQAQVDQLQQKLISLDSEINLTTEPQPPPTTATPSSVKKDLPDDTSHSHPET